jgi:FMN phosphatase YigB (HAD superfamily)
MIISFDIDNTLIPLSNEFHVEESTLLSKILGAETIRKGTVDLFHQLKKKDHEIWIYTTSYRSTFHLRKTFFSYGLHPSRIINEKTNRAVLSLHNCSASKNPKLFGIDLHIDDARGVEMEGERHGFKTLIIKPEDKDWIIQVLERVEEIGVTF